MLYHATHPANGIYSPKLIYWLIHFEALEQLILQFKFWKNLEESSGTLHPLLPMVYPKAASLFIVSTKCFLKKSLNKLRIHVRLG